MRTYVHVVSTKCSVNQILKTNIFTSVKRLLGRPVPQRHMSAWWCGLCVLCTIPGGKTNLPLYSGHTADIRITGDLMANILRITDSHPPDVQRTDYGFYLPATHTDRSSSQCTAKTARQTFDIFRSIKDESLANILGTTSPNISAISISSKQRKRREGEEKEGRRGEGWKEG